MSEGNEERTIEDAKKAEREKGGRDAEVE